jgi:hypothetical protein
MLETMRRKGWKDGYLYTIVPTGTCAKAVFSCLSQHQHGWGCQGKLCGCDCPSQLQKIPFSNFWTLKTIEKFCEWSSIGQINIISNSGGLKTGLGQDAREVWGLKPLSKQCGSRFAKIHSQNRRSCPETWTYQPNKCRALSGTIYTWETTSGQRDTFLHPLWRSARCWPLGSSDLNLLD